MASKKLLTKWAPPFSKRPKRRDRAFLATVLECPFWQEFLPLPLEMILQEEEQKDHHRQRRRRHVPAQPAPAALPRHRLHQPIRPPGHFDGVGVVQLLLERQRGRVTLLRVAGH